MVMTIAGQMGGAVVMTIAGHMGGAIVGGEPEQKSERPPQLATSTRRLTARISSTFGRAFPSQEREVVGSIPTLSFGGWPGDLTKFSVVFADEARIGQKTKITRRWAKRGSRPSAPRDQRTASTYIFGAICPKEGKGAALILPACNTEAMNLHLTEIAKTVSPASHAVLLSIRPDGICRHDWSFQPISPSSPCRTASSNPTTISQRPPFN